MTIRYGIFQLPRHVSLVGGKTSRAHLHRQDTIDKICLEGEGVIGAVLGAEMGPWERWQVVTRSRFNRPRPWLHLDPCEMRLKQGSHPPKTRGRSGSLRFRVLPQMMACIFAVAAGQWQARLSSLAPIGVPHATVWTYVIASLQQPPPMHARPSSRFQLSSKGESGGLLIAATGCVSLRLVPTPYTISDHLAPRPFCLPASFPPFGTERPQHRICVT